MFDKLYSLLSSIGITKHQDKVLHFIAGFLVTIIVAYLVSPHLGLTVGIAVGLGKELWDEYGETGFNELDLLVTALGAVTAYGITFI